MTTDQIRRKAEDIGLRTSYVEALLKTMVDKIDGGTGSRSNFVNDIEALAQSALLHVALVSKNCDQIIEVTNQKGGA